MNRLSAGILLLILFLCSTAGASPIEYNFQFPQNGDSIFTAFDSRTFDLGSGLEVTVSGSIDDRTSASFGLVTQNIDGLSIIDSHSNLAYVDGASGVETLWLEFNQEVSLDAVNLWVSHTDNGEAIDVIVDGELAVENFRVTGGGWFDVTAGVGTRLGLRADAPIDRFQLRDIRVSISAVPEPTTLLLVSCGLLGMAGLRRG